MIIELVHRESKFFRQSERDDGDQFDERTRHGRRRPRTSSDKVTKTIFNVNKMIFNVTEMIFNVTKMIFIVTKTIYT